MGAVEVAEALPGLSEVVARALAEDVGRGDATTDGLFDPDVRATAALSLKEEGVLAGLPVVETVFRALDADATFTALARDGATVGPAEVLRVSARVRALLTGERTALNLLGRLSGIATLTRRYVDAVAGTGATVLDTRKTTPGLRALEKYAVRCGGGTNHRLGLDDGILVKDNHLQLAGGIPEVVARLRAAGSGLPIEVECDTLEQVGAALGAGADRILLDNMTFTDQRAAVALVAGRVPLEASGGITLETIRAVAETGVDFVSVGALTHAARSLDVGMEIER